MERDYAVNSLCAQARHSYREPMTAELWVLNVGYAGDRVASSVVLLRDGDTTVVVDPGMVSDRRRILDPLKEIGLQPDDVTDVVFSHHHPDHTINAALFANARYHDHWAYYVGDRLVPRDAEGYALSESIRLIRTPGHTAEDITTLVDTADGLVALTHVWWTASGPAVDPLANDNAVLSASRSRLLGLSPALVIPGHGPAFVPNADTPR